MINFLKSFSIIYYKLFPKPFGIGYNQYKIFLIKKILKNKKIFLKKYVDERVVEIPWTIKNLDQIKNSKILDAGCTLNFDYLIKRIIKNKNHITFVNLFPERNTFKSDFVSYKHRDILELNYAENTFDAITCISVLEHIGFDNSMYDFNNTKKNFEINSDLYKKVFLKFNMLLKPNCWLYLTFPFGKKMSFNNYQQFNIDDVNIMLDNFAPKEYFLKFYKYEINKWNEVSHSACKEVEAIYKDKTGISSNSIALLKMRK